MADRTSAEITVIGGGPAGLAAALAVDGAKGSLVIVNDGAWYGGQIWRDDLTGEPPPRAIDWLDRMESSNAWPMLSATVIAARTQGTTHVLTIERDGRVVELETKRIILATGARELLLPFPGWTLPGVLGVGGAQALAKSGFDVYGKRVVVAGSGPLLVAVAASLSKRGAKIVALVEQAPRRKMVALGARMLATPSIARDAIAYMSTLFPRILRMGQWVTEARGSDRVREVTITDGQSARSVECDLLCVGYGLVPNVELAHLLGCECSRDGIVVDENQQTTVPGIYAAGECVGIAGVDAALAEGTIAGYAAAGLPERGAGHHRRRRSARDWGRRLATTFALRPELLALATAETIVCRCEDVRMGDIDPSWTGRQAKLYARVGMGPCQGRVCGPALAQIRGWSPDRIRAPVYPSFLSSLAATAPPPNTTGAT